MGGKTIGILALQGAFLEHEQSLRKCKVKSIQIRNSYELDLIDGLIIPGGESTVIGKLLLDYRLFDKIKQKAAEKLPIFGTCAGMILMAKEIIDYEQPKLGLMDIKVKRNAFGRQVESFETDLEIDEIGKTKGVFIRAPYIESLWGEVKPMCTYQKKIVMARQGSNLLVTAFHPELTAETVIHEYFIKML